MGLFDGLLGAPQTPQVNTGGLLSNDDALYALASGLMGNKKGEGLAGLGRGLTGAVDAYQKDQQQERANRQSDLAQLQGTYTLLKQQEFQRMVAAQQSGQPYTPNPMLAQIETKMATLVGSPSLTGTSTSPQRAAPQPPAQAAPSAASALPQGVTSTQLAAGGFPQPVQSPQPQVPAQATVGAPAGGQPAAWWLAQDPSGKSYMEQLAKDYTETQKPVINRGFGVGRMVNGQYVPDQASTDQALGLEKGKLNLSQPFETQNVTDASGAVRPQFKYQLSGYPGSQPGGATPAAAAPKVASLDVTQPSPNAASNDPWATIPKRVIPQGTGQTTYDKGVADQQAGATGELTKKFGELASVNNQRIATNNQALDLVDKADTGWLASHVAAFRPVLAAAGFPEQGYKAATDQELTKDLTNTALARGKQLFGSRFTQSEVGIMLSQANPGPNMQKVAMKFLLQSDNAQAQYGIQQSADLGKYLQRGGDPQRFEGWYAQTFPATNALAQVKSTAPNAAQAAPSPRAPSADPLVVVDPNGVSHRFPSAMAAQAFRKAISQ